jgi:CRISPR system Cascade subunit CasA
VQNRRTFNLISAPWIPVIRESGRRDRIQPARLTDEIDTDPIRDLDFPRPDFRCAALEFLIGLLTVACPPCDDWKARWTSPPSRAKLEAAFAPFAAALTFDGEGPRAFDLEEFSTKPTPVEALLIEAPGAETKRKNAALLVKAGLVEVLSRPAVSIALITLQTMAPMGGEGHRTSLRGGGPLTTLVVPKFPATLWHRLWANVPPGGSPAKPAEMPRIFPWLVPTRFSNEEGQTTTPQDVDWRQTFFGMPRRIRLNFEANLDRRPCDLTGEIDDVIVRTYRTLKHGTKYDAWGGIHPLTPHSCKAGNPTRYPVHGQGGRIGYRQWVAMLYGAKDGSCEPAQCVSLFVAERAGDIPRADRSFRLMAAGYDMDNKKARAFTEAETPDITFRCGGRGAVAEKARDFTAAANEVARTLSQAVKIALYGGGADVGATTALLTTARGRFWADTDETFFAILNDLSMLPAEKLARDATVPIAHAWRSVMERAALAIFDDMVPVQYALSPKVRYVVEGRRFLVLTLLGYGARGLELFRNLQLPAPETKTGKGKAA